MTAFASLLEPGGRIVLQVPAMARLYGEADRAVGAVRRYERAELAAALRRHGFEVEMLRYVNLPGVVSQYVRSRLLRQPSLNGRDAHISGILLPWLRLELRLNLPCGTTLLAAGRKTRDTSAAAAFVLVDTRRT